MGKQKQNCEAFLIDKPCIFTKQEIVLFLYLLLVFEISLQIFACLSILFPLYFATSRFCLFLLLTELGKISLENLMCAPNGST